ncbi:S-adenosylmethionine decarboxylase proenzyme-like [Olea europaea subsp. europaea]|uniref:S-adenosylmethionine decarboxylase proenzyme-like n=1 Tax=Olea europaea subsp. europaea TaxID=158383 RepID=A0A8S0TEM3_OLEEU|nr:S-adenosylmethionine decarboxylase proenzyme-like [Olea europaea subsp. europaea]
MAFMFYKSDSSSAALMTNSSSIRKILPTSEICDFEFESCGYSMNSIEEDAISNIHVTPEDGFSYASFEVAGYNLKEVNLSQLIERVLVCFHPKEFSIAMHADIGEMLFDNIYSYDLKGYSVNLKCYEDLGLDGAVVYRKFA